jgi:hypothetical protein
MEETVDIKRFLDDSGRLIQYPRKQKIRMAALKYLTEKFETGRVYTESEVNGTLNLWHTFGDQSTLRRALIDAGLLTRKLDGTEYRRAEAPLQGADS